MKKILFIAGIYSGPLIIVFVLMGLFYFISWNICQKISEILAGNDYLMLAGTLWKDLKNPLAGTLIVTVLSVAFSAPLGIITGIYFHEYAGEKIRRHGMNLFRYLSSLPSIVIGVFGLIIIITLNHLFGSGIRTGLMISVFSLSVLILPYIVQSVFGALSMIPTQVRITALSVGAKKHQNILFVLLPESLPGILGGLVLSIGRAAEDTAVIMLTGAAAYAGILSKINDSFEALPFFIYYRSSEYQGQIELAEIFIASALIILICTAFISAADLLINSMKKRMKGEKH